MNTNNPTLEAMLDTGTAYTAAGDKIAVHSGLSRADILKLQELTRSIGARHTLEIGMAMGFSTLSLLDCVTETDGAHIAIDPYQRHGDSEDGWEGWLGTGLTMVERAGQLDRLHLIEEPSYLALPQLLREGKTFDLILIDGWHSFDYKFVDYFYADLLLKDGGILIFDDWDKPQVYHVTLFLEEHKAYEKLGPRTGNPINPVYRLRSKLGLTGEREWGSLCAFRKIKQTRVPWSFFASKFYPGFRLYRWWMRTRGRKVPRPFEFVVAGRAGT